MTVALKQQSMTFVTNQTALRAMKIAIATEDFENVAGHAGQSSRWLLYDCKSPNEIGAATRVMLMRDQVFHHWLDNGPHPLDGVDIMVARSAGDGFLRRMENRGVSVLLTGETLAEMALLKILAGEALPDPRWDASLVLCRIRDLFSRH